MELGSEGLLKLVEGVLIRDELEAMERPHVVIIEGPDGSRTVTGPYSTGFHAIAAAQAEVEDLADPAEPEVTATVAVLQRPHPAHSTAAPRAGLPTAEQEWTIRRPNGAGDGDVPR